MARFLPAKAVEDHRKYQEHLRLVHPQRGLWAMSYSGRHETSDIRTFAFGNGARDPRSGTALQRRLRDAPMPGNPGERPRAFSPEDRPELGMRLANGQERYTRLRRARTRRSHARIFAPQARPRRFRRKERRGSEGDAPPLPEGVRIRHELVDLGDGGAGEL